MSGNGLSPQESRNRAAGEWRFSSGAIGDIHPGLLLGAAAVLAAELCGAHPIILIGGATLLGAVTGFYIS